MANHSRSARSGQEYDPNAQDIGIMLKFSQR
jgi:hypothetical protein